MTYSFLQSWNCYLNSICIFISLISKIELQFDISFHNLKKKTFKVTLFNKELIRVLETFLTCTIMKIHCSLYKFLSNPLFYCSCRRSHDRDHSRDRDRKKSRHEDRHNRRGLLYFHFYDFITLYLFALVINVLFLKQKVWDFCLNYFP